MELFTATSPFANHQPTTVPVWAQNSSLQTCLHMILHPRTIEEWTYLLTYLVTIVITHCACPMGIARLSWHGCLATWRGTTSHHGYLPLFPPIILPFVCPKVGPDKRVSQTVTRLLKAFWSKSWPKLTDWIIVLSFLCIKYKQQTSIHTAASKTLMGDHVKKHKKNVRIRQLT